ncbi:DUF3072 domain-containing protein [Caldimonas brevitalea]|uniref:DUF3072 domain-containing protein n=1 Tax=Caldimonas brevitalea TaxID=413882 RepID=A0A0G3BK27_9BURK|nr:DUF3072 domain-containing protein [Caldimonas brevitalea]AKJ29784.1 hypothetical protein AAW51_3093 [Caldimonas brevitalea]
MTDKRTQASADQSNMQKDPDDWVTGDEPMTGAQRSYLKTLSEEAKQPFDEHLTKAQASRRIDELQQITGRGQAAAETGEDQDPDDGDHVSQGHTQRGAPSRGAPSSRNA